MGNESAADVYFDDVSIEHRQGLQVQETQYDPAGLELAGRAPPSPGLRGLNHYRFNGKEFQADLGLAWNHQDWRFFDPQLLRWHAGDPELENGQESWTPYSFGYDNTTRYNDPNGRCPCEGILTSIVSFSNGVTAALADNASLGLSTAREVQGRNIGSAQAGNYNAGQDFGDRVSQAVGNLETAAAIVEGLALAGGEVLSLGTATLPVAAAAPLVAAQAAHGLAMANRATNSIKDQNGRVNASRDTSPARDQNHIDNGHVNRQNAPDKSKYSKPNQAPKLEQRTMKNPDRITSQRDGSVRFPVR